MGFQLIINADDAGIDARRNEGIIEAFEKGPVRSATAIVNGPAFSEIAQYAAAHPDLGLGLHFNLTDGEPMSREGAALSRGGAFLPKRELWPRALRGEITGEAVAAELKAQLEAFLRTGLVPTHLDGHNHIHLFPRVLDACLDALEDFPEIRALRIPLEICAPLRGTFSSDGVPADPGGNWCAPARQLHRAGQPKGAFFHELADRARRRLPAGFSHPSEFAGISLAEHFTRENLRLTLESFCKPVAELMTHPGYCDPGSVSYSAQPGRETELRVLTSREFQEQLASQEASLENYRTASL